MRGINSVLRIRIQYSLKLFSKVQKQMQVVVKRYC